jgi:S-sulfosulfanyl-L-cysteine sulfohydrolase
VSGQRLRDILEDVADNLLNPDPYYQQGGDMIRCGGVGYTIDPLKPVGKRIADMRLLKSGQPIESDKDYTVASWACMSDTVEGPPIWDVVEAYVSRKGTVGAGPASAVKLVDG